MARHRRRRNQRPTIVIPGSSQTPSKPVVTTVLVAGSLLALPGLVQPGVGDSAPLEGSARMKPPTNALGVPRLSDYDEQGRLTIEAVPGAISAVAGVSLGPAPVDVSPEVTAAVTAVIREQSPLLSAMTFGPDDVETVKINELGVPVVGGTSSGDTADLLASPVVEPVGEATQSGPEAEAGAGGGLALGEDRAGESLAGTEGAGGPGAIRGDDGAYPVVDRTTPGDSPEGPAAGGSAPDAPESPRDSAPCPVEETVSSGSGNGGSGSSGGSVVEGPSEVDSGAPGDRDSGSVPVVEVVDHSSGPVTDDLDTPDSDVDVHGPDRPAGNGASKPDVGTGGSGGDSPEPDPVEPRVPSVPDEVDVPVVDPEPVVDDVVDEVEETVPDVVDEPVEEVSEPDEDQSASDDDADDGSGSGDDTPVVVVDVDLPVDVDDPSDSVDEPRVDKPEKVREDEGDKPDKVKENDDHSGDTGRENAVPDSREDADEKSKGQEADRGSSDDSEDEEKSSAGERDSDSGSSDEREHSDDGPESAESDSDHGDSRDSGDDSSDDGGESS